MPFADYGPRKVPEDLNDDQALFLTDIFPTGWSAIHWAQLQGGETVAVFGAGPVGIMAGKSAWLQGADRVLMVDIELARAAVGQALQALDTDPAKASAAVSVAKSRAGRSATLAVQEGVQLHGGMGMTDAFDMGFFMKRVRVLQERYGDAGFHADRLAALGGY